MRTTVTSEIMATKQKIVRDDVPRGGRTLLAPVAEPTELYERLLLMVGLRSQYMMMMMMFLCNDEDYPFLCGLLSFSVSVTLFLF